MGLLGRMRVKRRRFSVRPLSIDPGLFVGAQIDEHGIEELWRAGFRSIVDLSYEGEPGQVLSSSVEASCAHTFAIDHVRLSVGSSPLATEFERLCQLLTALPTLIYMHSIGGERALALGVACVARRRGWSADQALRELECRTTLRSDTSRRFLVQTLAAKESFRPA